MSSEQNKPSYFNNVPPLRFALFFFSSFGIYGLVWIYKRWELIKKENNLKLIPFWRSIFTIIFFWSFANNIKKICLKNEIKVNYDPGILTAIYTFFWFSGWFTTVIPHIVLLKSFLIIIPFIPLVKAMNEYDIKNESKQVKPIFWWIHIGVSLLLIIRISTLLISSKPNTDIPIPVNEQGNIELKKTNDANLAEDKHQAQLFLDNFIKDLSDLDKQKDYTFSVKIPFTEDNQTEHMWVKVTSYKNGVFMGQLANDPIYIKKLKIWDNVSVLRSDVEDWIIRNNKDNADFRGGFSLKDM